MTPRACFVMVFAGTLTAHGVAAADPARFEGAGEIFTSGEWTSTDAGRTTAFELRRAELGAGVEVPGRGGAELRLEAIRAAAPGSAIGIDGNSLVVRVKRAWAFAMWDTGAVRLEARGGLVPDPWLEAVEVDYGLRALALTAAESGGLVASSDLGLGAVITAWDERLRAQLDLTNGEGRNQLEQNDGKNLSAALTVEAARFAGGRLLVHAYGRDGSTGAGSVRSHRLAGAVTLALPRASAGVELVRALGVAERPDVTAFAFGGWGEVRPVERAGVAARLDVLALDGPVDQDVRTTRVSLAAFHDVWRTPRAAGHASLSLRAYLAGQLDRTDADASPVPGVPAATDATRLLLILAMESR